MTPPELDLWVRRTEHAGLVYFALRFEARTGRGSLRITKGGLGMDTPASPHGFEDGLDAGELAAAHLWWTPGDGRDRVGLDLSGLDAEVLLALEEDIWTPVLIELDGSGGVLYIDAQVYPADEHSVINLGGEERGEEPPPAPFEETDSAALLALGDALSDELPGLSASDNAALLALQEVITGDHPATRAVHLDEDDEHSLGIREHGRPVWSGGSEHTNNDAFVFDAFEDSAAEPPPTWTPSQRSSTMMPGSSIELAALDQLLRSLERLSTHHLDLLGVGEDALPSDLLDAIAQELHNASQATSILGVDADFIDPPTEDITGVLMDE